LFDLEDMMNIKFKVILLLVSFLFSGTAISADSGGIYKLNQGDLLQISVWGEETLQKEVRVLPDGSITFPLAGRVEVANETAPEVEKRITEKLKVYLPDPQVTVVVSNTEGNKAYVIGKVMKPGPVQLTGSTTVLQAISLAGGVDKFADLNTIKVLRGSGKAQSTLPVNYNSLIKGQNLDSNILLNSGDTVLVP
jgi:polysaccharide export outer membrane protein